MPLVGTEYENAYDRIPYIHCSFPEVHPRRLQTVAAMYGVQSPPIQRARVLELGCAGGWNLLPLSHQFPEARFVGIDLSCARSSRRSRWCRISP